MRTILDVLRLRLEAGLSERHTARSLGVPRSTLQDYLARFRVSGWTWSQAHKMEPAALERALFTCEVRLPATNRALPDWATIAQEKKRKGVTLEREQLARENRRLTRLLQLARLHHPASIEDVNFRVKRGLDKSQLLRLAAGEWIQQHGVLLITGPTGTGKSWFACALGQSACRHGYTVRYLRLPRLLPEFIVARSDGTYSKLFTQLGKADLLILDNWGLAPIGDRERRDLLEMVEDRKGRRATLLTSQVPVEHWHECVGDATFGDAILARLVHHAHRITLT